MTNQFSSYVKKAINGDEGGKEQERTGKITSRKRKLELTMGIFLLLLVISSVLSLSPLILKISNQFHHNEKFKNGENVLVEKKATLIKELKANGLFQKLKEAGLYCDLRSTDGENKALTLYREVIAELSPGVCQGLDSTLLNEAESDFRNKHYTHALRKYKAWFDKLINDPGAKLLSYRR